MRPFYYAAILLFLAGLLLLVGAPLVPPTDAKTTVAVVSTTGFDGHTGPCGCHIPKGGLARLASFVDSTRIRYGAPVLVDAGDWSGPDPEAGARGQFFMDMMQSLSYDAVTVGELELAHGYKNFLQQAKKYPRLTIVQANLRDRSGRALAWKPYVVVKRQGVRVAIAGLLSKAVPLGAAEDELTVDDPLAVAEKLVPEMRKQADLVVLLAHVGRVDGEDIAAQVPGIDVLVNGHSAGLLLTSRMVDRTTSVASGIEGQNVGETVFDCDAGKCVQRHGKVVVLYPEVGERGDVARIVKSFEDSLAVIYPKPKPPAAPADSAAAATPDSTP
jgi:2',3'-cyclic-nucleotide 2'-phosphodiesterase (5'-nucleotidase family)